MTTYTITDPWSLSDEVWTTIDGKGRKLACYRDGCGKLRTCVVNEPLCTACDEPADECVCGAQQVMEDAA